ncbi:thioredoxin/dynein outer arm protein [Thraustotheca clavata]|uniref:Thioredoxin/dynein outer arm protein n=1 Tax=Thraustotheca clavata TaxID=74557 RepID=A0A1W0A3X8_9STRA|nr:thioredoxin/dynein outer arm protein [Thraustotheca clavata]
MADKDRSIAVNIRDLDQWDHLRENSIDKLIVIDLYQDWCGPTRVLEPTYRRIISDTTSADARLQFAAVCSTTTKIDGISENLSCKPRFVLWRDKKTVGEVVGVNVPALETLIKQNLPAAKAEENSS